MRDEPLSHPLRVSAAELNIDVRKVSLLAQCGPGRRWKDNLKAAVDEALSLARPSADFFRVPAGENWDGLFPSATPVRAIVEGGKINTLFAATLGQGLENQVAEYFERAHFLEGVLLDAAGSVAVESLCDLVELKIAAGLTSNRFSPGYCGWPMEGQARLFELLEPQSIGIRLLPSMLMKPLKSVTGIVVVAEEDTLRVPPEECAVCDAKGCSRRRARARSTSPTGESAVCSGTD